MTDFEPTGPTEFSWGRGIQAPESEGAVPSLREQHRAILGTSKDGRSEDSGTVANYDDYVRE